MKLKFKTQYVLLFLTLFLIGFIMLYMYVRQIEQMSVKNTHTIQQILCIQEDLGVKMNELHSQSGALKSAVDGVKATYVTIQTPPEKENSPVLNDVHIERVPTNLVMEMIQELEEEEEDVQDEDVDDQEEEEDEDVDEDDDEEEEEDVDVDVDEDDDEEEEEEEEDEDEDDEEDEDEEEEVEEEVEEEEKEKEEVEEGKVEEEEEGKVEEVENTTTKSYQEMPPIEDIVPSSQNSMQENPEILNSAASDATLKLLFATKGGRVFEPRGRGGGRSGGGRSSRNGGGRLQTLSI
jgi:hypothetical protein